MASRAAALLRKWRHNNQLSQPEAADMFGIGSGGFMSISRWERGHVKPGRRFACVIDKVTNGAVPITSWDEPDESDVQPLG